MTSPMDDEWVAVGNSSWWASFAAGPLWFTLVPVCAPYLALLFLPDLPLAPKAGIMVTAVLLVWAVTLVIARAVYPVARLNAATSTIRVGRKQVPYAGITSAQLLVVNPRGRRALHLLLRDDYGVRVVVLVRDAKLGTLAPRDAALVQHLVRESNIAMPTTHDDPMGRFARYNFPTNVTLAEGLELLEHPPAFADAIPIPPPV
ncbi:hypothetical protein [Cryobacterium sp. AP23]